MADTQHHVVAPATYYLVFAALVGLTALTVGLDFVPLGPLHTAVGLTIATVKALLVILFFMHVRWSSRFTWVITAAGFFWLLILFGITMSDYMSRGWIAGSLR